MAEHAVVEYESKIAISGDHGHAIADFPGRAGRELDGGVFGGEAEDGATGIIGKDGRRPIVADRFAADVEDRAVLGGSADDGGQEGQRGDVALDVTDLRVILTG